MRKLFIDQGIEACGGLPVWHAVASSTQEPRVNQAHCYYAHDNDLLRNIQNGFMDCLLIDGERKFFTGKTHTAPPVNAHIAWYGFGLAPVEIRLIVNKPAYLDMMERNGTPLKVHSVMVEPMHAAAVLRPAGTPVSRNQLRGLSS